MSQATRSLNVGRIGALVDIGLAVLFTILLLAGRAQSAADVVRRPLVLGVLYATPGLIGLIGVLRCRWWLLIAAGLALLPGAILSFTGVTLVFIAPAAILLVAGADMRPREAPWRWLALAITGIVGIAVLIDAAGWAAIIGLTTEGCAPTPGGQDCGNGLISVPGIAVAALCLVAAYAVAIMASGTARLRRRWPS